MGQISVDIVGSFEPRRRVSFSAVSAGHAAAVAEAIAFLSGEVLPAAIEQDHELQEQGHYPQSGFGTREKEPEVGP
ncbi:MAG: hypothetical protein ACYSYL_00045 [Planctomycetota bacterium]|jgi:hypothetical protein